MKQGSSSASFVTWCGNHRKRLYARRSHARRAIRTLHEPGMREYRCTRFTGLWHVGHIAEPVRRGEQTAGEYYGRVR